MSSIADLSAFAPHRPGEARQPIYVSGTGSYIKLDGPNEFCGAITLPPLLAHPGVIFIRLLKKDGTPGLGFVSKSYHGFADWLPEGQSPEETAP